MPCNLPGRESLAQWHPIPFIVLLSFGITNRSEVKAVMTISLAVSSKLNHVFRETPEFGAIYQMFEKALYVIQTYIVNPSL